MAGKSGLVEDLTLRYVQLRDYEGNVHYVPNGEIGVVTSSSRTFAYAVVDVIIALDQDIAPVIEVMRETGAQLRAQLGVRSEDPRRPGHRRHRNLERSRHHAARTHQGARARAGECASASTCMRLKHAFDKADIQQPRSTVTIVERAAGGPRAGARRPASNKKGRTRSACGSAPRLAVASVRRDGALRRGAGAAGAAFAFPAFLLEALVEPAPLFLVAALRARRHV